jgi:5'-nucleotidase
VFVHVNDTYRVGAVEDGAKGGFARVVTVIRELQQQGRDVHILHGGDFLYPSLESQLWRGMQMVDAMNFLDGIAPLHATTGNHEFDPRSPDHLVAAVRASRFDWLGSNYRFATGNSEVDARLQQTLMFEHGGRRIGIFALTAHPDDGGSDRTYVPIQKDYIAAARRAIASLEAAGADAIIAVTHLHLVDDVELARLRGEHPSFVFVVGGHDHEPQYVEGTVATAAVMKGASNARSIWVVDLSFGEDGLPRIEPRMIDMGDTVAEDEAYAELEQKWREQLYELYPILTARVGEAAVPLNVTEERIRSSENGWGNFIVDQMRKAFGGPHADFAFINSGTLRIDDYVAGDITFEDIARTFGFSSFLRYMPISGSEFLRLMEAGFRGSGSQGYFPQVSGFRVCVDRSLPEFQRIVSLQVPADEGWREIETERVYSLVVPDFLYNGGDGYELPKHRAASKPGSELKYLVLDAIIRAQAEGRAVGALPDTDNPRTVELDETRSACWGAQ